jgi:cell division protein FtsB
MAYQKKKNIIQSIIFSRGMVLVLFFLSIFTGFGVYGLIGKSVDASRERKHSEEQMLILQKKEEELSRKINALQTSQGREEAFREQLSVVSEGEEVIVVTDPAIDLRTTSTLVAEPEPRGFLHFLKNLF